MNNTGIFHSLSTNSDSRSLESFNTDSSMVVENVDNIFFRLGDLNLYNYFQRIIYQLFLVEQIILI